MFNTPILFLIFNRPENTEIVFEEIKKQKPKYLFVTADGSRSNNLEDIEKCNATRQLVIEGMDWDCELKKLFRDVNLDCKIEDIYLTDVGKFLVNQGYSYFAKTVNTVFFKV